MLRSLPFLLAFLLLAGASAAKEPRLTLKHTARGIEAHGISQANLDKLARSEWERGQWTKLFPITLESRVPVSERPAMLGGYHVRDNALLFEPRFPLSPGSSYRATLNPKHLPQPSEADPVSEVISIPKPDRKPTAVVTHIYPSATKVPENLLKLYIHFSEPMTRGQAYKHIELLDGEGKKIEDPFLELGEELWDRDQKRFTLFFDPGRVKRELKPRLEEGPPLQEGRTFTVVVRTTWDDTRGAALKTEHRKKLIVVGADDQCPKWKQWKIDAPLAGTTQPLKVHFDEPLDHALLQRMLRITSTSKRTIRGTIRTAEDETVWLFTPEKPWQAGDYTLNLNSDLEDLAGNGLLRPFEVELEVDQPMKPVAEQVTRSFMIAARPRKK